MPEGPKGEYWHPIAVWADPDTGDVLAGMYTRGSWSTKCRVIQPIIQLQEMGAKMVNTVEEAKFVQELAARIERLEKQDQVTATARAFEYFKAVHKKTEKTKEVQLDLKDSRLLHGAIGLASEAGEVLDLVKKKIFGYHYEGARKAELVKELGDCAWYFYLILDSAGITIEEVLTANADKLTERYLTKKEAV